MENDLLAQLQTLTRRPRVLIGDADIERIRTLVKTDPQAKQLLSLVQYRAEQFLVSPLPVRQLEGRRLLGVSRTVLNGVLSMALTFLATGDDRYARKAVDTMLAAADFSDWNPTHFLDVGEMTLALGIGYDWLHDKLTESEKQRIEDAILTKGLAEGAKFKDEWWVISTNNWNPVCHTGLSIGALAVAQRDPKLAAFTLDRAIQNIPRVGTAYAPDGAYDEGSMYWGYGTTFLVLMLAALKNAFGNTYDLDKIPGLIGSAHFMKHVVGPTQKYFDYSDNREAVGPQPAMLWFADHCNDPSLATSDLKLMGEKHAPEGAAKPIAKEGEGDRFLGLFLLWYRATKATAPAGNEPLTWHGAGPTPVALMRTEWSPRATFLGIKGGSASVSHAHMDVGSFVLDAGGVRWIKDLGMQEYYSLESAGINMWNAVQGGQRWKVFRLGPDSHNILRVGNAEQSVAASATLHFSQPAGLIGRAVVDLSPIYTPLLHLAERTADLLPDGRAIIEDRWTPGNTADAISTQLITDCAVTLNGHRIELRKDEKRLTITIESTAEIAIAVDDVSAGYHPTDAPNPGTSRIRITVQKATAGDQWMKMTFALA